MSLMTALNSAVTGLKANQIGIDVVSRNVANAGTDGYTRKISPRENSIGAGEGMGVRVLAEKRQVDFHLVQKLRTEQSRSARLDTVANFLDRVDQLFGKPQDQSSISYRINDLATTIGSLVDTPENAGVRATVVAKADDIARNLNQLSESVQAMRSEAEQGIASAVEDVNGALQAIESLNREIANRQAANLTTADLEDRRDIHVKTLAANLDIRCIERTDGGLTIFTAGGQTLVGERAARLEFDGRKHLGPDQLYSNDASERGVGTLTLVSYGGTRVDLLKDAPPREGKIAGLLKVRDESLVEAQNQLDELAQSLAMAMADKVTDLTTADSNTATTDLDIDMGQLAAAKDGDRFVFTYQTAAGTRTVTAYLYDGSDGSTPASMSGRVPDPGNAVFVDITAAGTTAKKIYDQMVGSGGVPASMLNDPGATNTLTVPSALTGRVREVSYHALSASASGQGPELPMFMDGTYLLGGQKPYTGSITDSGYAKQGFAQRISINDELLSDHEKLVVYTQSDGSETSIGNSARPQLLLDRLTESRYQFSSSTNLGGQGHAYSGTVLDLARAVTSYQGQQAATAGDLATDQGRRTQMLDERFQSQSGVDVDDEMAQLIMLQSSYSAAAKVVKTIDAMFDDLMSLR